MSAKPNRVWLVLEVEEPEDMDLDRRSGLTQDAEDRLFEALADEGFTVAIGPRPESGVGG